VKREKSFMARKRYFFVHLVIFAAVCGTFAVAGISSYRDFIRTRGSAFAQAAERGGNESRDAAGKSAIPVLALSANLASK
jgi:hypothetical protein